MAAGSDGVKRILYGLLIIVVLAIGVMLPQAYGGDAPLPSIQTVTPAGQEACRVIQDAIRAQGRMPSPCYQH
jgi:hypothetical protein